MNKERMVHPITGADNGELRSRQELVAEWREARYEDVQKYPAGSYITDDGKILYPYRAGSRLIIEGQEVMDTCEEPWANRTVDRAFGVLGDKQNVQVLERGFGMGIVATRIIQHLEMRGGNYTCIELNEQVAEYADGEWTKKQRSLHRNRAGTVIGGQYDPTSRIGVNILRGDAFEKTAELAEEGKKFDIIISDTYPLSEEEKSLNDLLDIATLIRCLNPDGVFAFFSYYNGSGGTMNARQRNIVDRYFEVVETTHVEVRPPKEYMYLNPPSGPVRYLPVIICTKPRIQPIS